MSQVSYRIKQITSAPELTVEGYSQEEYDEVVAEKNAAIAEKDAVLQTTSNLIQNNVSGSYNPPLTITKIGDYAFYNNINLTSITLSSNIRSIGAHAFEGCSGLTQIQIPWQAVDNIGEGTFKNCTSMRLINTSLGNVGSQAFFNCYNLSNGSSIYTENVGEYAFAGSNIVGVSVSSNKNISMGAFQNCSYLQNVFFGDNVHISSIETFLNCSALTSNSVNNILLKKNGNLIPEGTFQGCSSITTITLPAGTDYLGSDAFKNCTNLAEIKYEGTVQQWNSHFRSLFKDSVFMNCPANIVKCSDGNVTLRTY